MNICESLSEREYITDGHSRRQELGRGGPILNLNSHKQTLPEVQNRAVQCGQLTDRNVDSIDDVLKMRLEAHLANQRYLFREENPYQF